MQITYSLFADYTTLVFHNGRLHLCYQHFFGISSTKKSNLQFFACEDVYQTVKSKHPPITMVGIEPTSPRFALPLSYRSEERRVGKDSRYRISRGNVRKKTDYMIAEES